VLKNTISIIYKKYTSAFLDGKKSKNESFFVIYAILNKSNSSKIKITNMKKLVLVPQTDTITICLPASWVGQTVVCILKVSDVIIYEKDIPKHQKRSKA